MTSLKHEQLLCSWLPLESYVGNILYIISWFNARKEPAVQMHLSGVGSRDPIVLGPESPIVETGTEDLSSCHWLHALF